MYVINEIQIPTCSKMNLSVYLDPKKYGRQSDVNANARIYKALRAESLSNGYDVCIERKDKGTKCMYTY